MAEKVVLVYLPFNEKPVFACHNSFSLLGVINIRRHSKSVNQIEPYQWLKKAEAYRVSSINFFQTMPYVVWIFLYYDLNKAHFEFIRVSGGRTFLVLPLYTHILIFSILHSRVCSRHVSFQLGRYISCACFIQCVALLHINSCYENIHDFKRLTYSGPKIVEKKQ